MNLNPLTNLPLFPVVKGYTSSPKMCVLSWLFMVLAPKQPPNPLVDYRAKSTGHNSHSIAAIALHIIKFTSKA
jgi:hypothetical protein